MMEESKKMIQDTSTRLEKGVEELVAVIVRPFLLLWPFFYVLIENVAFDWHICLDVSEEWNGVDKWWGAHQGRRDT